MNFRNPVDALHHLGQVVNVGVSRKDGIEPKYRSISFLLQSYLTMIGVGDAVGTSPDGISVIDIANQPHGQKSVLGRPPLNRSIINDDISKTGNLCVPRRIVIVPGNLFLRIPTVLIGIGSNDGQGLGTVALGAGEDAAKDDAAPLQIDIEMEPMPPLGG